MNPEHNRHGAMIRSVVRQENSGIVSEVLHCKRNSTKVLVIKCLGDWGGHHDVAICVHAGAVFGFDHDGA